MVQGRELSKRCWRKAREQLIWRGTLGFGVGAVVENRLDS